MCDAFRSGAALVAELRGCARATLPEGAFLRRDRGGGLFVTDAPRFRTAEECIRILARAGFIAEPAGSLLRLTPGPRWLQALAATWPEPPDDLCRTLRRFDGPPDGESLALFALGAKALEGAQGAGDFSRRLRQRAALCLRGGAGWASGETRPTATLAPRQASACPGGGLYACGLLLHLIPTKNGTP